MTIWEFVKIQVRELLLEKQLSDYMPVAGKSFSVSYTKYGTPALLDGTTQLASPQDLHFWKPDAICGKSIAFVGSLVTY